jgi:membrane protein DedA with SNARE-associated domain
MDFLMDLIQQYGYYVVFVGTLLEGETIVALAGFVAYQGHLHLGTLIPVAIIGATLGDHMFFFLGRHKGRKILQKHPEWHARTEKIHVWLERHQNLLIFGSRFLYGFRAVTPIILGTSKVSAIRFSILNIFGAVVWSLIFIFGGYVFGGAIEHFLGSVKKFEGIIVGLVIAIASIIQLTTLYRRRKARE